MGVTFNTGCCVVGSFCVRKGGKVAMGCVTRSGSSLSVNRMPANHCIGINVAGAKPGTRSCGGGGSGSRRFCICLLVC